MGIPDGSEHVTGQTLQDRRQKFRVMFKLKTGGLRRKVLGLTSFRSKEEGGEGNANDATQALVLSALGMFVGYVGHDAFQERMFRFDGFEFGWFMTLAEVTIMLLGAVLSEGPSLRRPPGGTRTMTMIAVVGICIAGSHGFGNTALRYSSYPLKVAFRSCKLVPTMALGVCMTGRRFNRVEYSAGLVMCTGLFVLSMAETIGTQSGHSGNNGTVYLGPVLLFLSTTLDSVVPNLQEKLLQQAHVRTVDMVFLSNLCMFIILTLYTLGSGELRTALSFCKDNPLVLKVLALQSSCAYCGLRCYLSVIRRHGGVAGVLLANARKIVTIVLSFLLFSKPCRTMHLVGLMLIFAGVYLGVVSKHKSGGKQQQRQQEAHQESEEQQNTRHEHVV